MCSIGVRLLPASVAGLGMTPFGLRRFAAACKAAAGLAAVDGTEAWQPTPVKNELEVAPKTGFIPPARSEVEFQSGRFKDIAA